MVCLGLKGGIGSASRIVPVDGKEYTVGALVMSNFGGAGNLVIGGKHYNTKCYSNEDLFAGKDKGSIIMVIATDIPLSERQLKRVAKRAMVSLGRVGSYCGTGTEVCTDIVVHTKLKSFAVDVVTECFESFREFLGFIGMRILL